VDSLVVFAWHTWACLVYIFLVRMIQAIFLDFFHVIQLSRNAPDAAEATHEDPTGLYRLNTLLLQYFRNLHEEKHIPVYIVTSSSPDEYAWVGDEISWVTQVYTAWKIGVHKGDRACYTELAARIAVDPKNIVFIDDSAQNIRAADEAGLQTIHFKNNTDTFTQFESLL
jgi:HAD superfamily hydrolase (TIGR01509 family)